MITSYFKVPKENRAGPHPSTQCPIKGHNISSTCFNCSGAHVASYKDCPIKIVAAEERFPIKESISREKSKDNSIEKPTISANQTQTMDKNSNTLNQSQTRTYAPAAATNNSQVDLMQVMTMLNQIVSCMSVLDNILNTYDFTQSRASTHS